MRWQRPVTKILVECPEMIASVRVGVLDPLAPLEKEGLLSIRFCRTADLKKQDVAWCDVYICVRGFEYVNCVLARMVKASGRFLVYFLDDDLGDMPANIPSAKFAHASDAKSHIKEILAQADVLWVVNELLAQKYSTWCKRVLLARVPARVEPIEEARFEETPLRVLYAGSTDHKEMVCSQLSPAIRQLSQAFPNHFSFTFIGADPQLPDLPNVRHIKFLDSYEAYQSTVREGRFAVGLAPLQDGFFYRCKYYNKFIEYTSRGIAGIYANQQPYTTVVKDGETGYLCGATPQAWELALQRCWADRGALRQCINGAQALLQQEFSEEAVGVLLKAQMPELLDYRATGKTVHWPLVPIKALYYWNRIRYNFYCFGVGTIFVLMSKAIRKIWRTLCRLSQ